MNSFTNWNDELCHSGKKGMKWGIRRYQNYDGTLTPEGRERYRAVTSNHKSEREKAINDKGGTKKGDDYSIKKGSSFYRIANENEPINSVRKYVSFTDKDRESYGSTIKNGTGLRADSEKPLVEYEYTAKKDLKVASERTVFKKMAERYDKEHADQLMQLYDEYEVVRDYPEITKTLANYSPKDRKTILQAQREYLSKRNAVLDFVGKATAYGSATEGSFSKQTISDPLVKSFIADGYDAVSDIFNSVAGSQFPVILLNPEDSIKNSKK